MTMFIMGMREGGQPFRDTKAQVLDICVTSFTYGPIVKLYILISDPFNCVRVHWRFYLLLLHHLRHPADDGGWTQVRPGPRGVHLCVAQPLPRHHQSVPISSSDHWKFKKLNFCFPV